MLDSVMLDGTKFDNAILGSAMFDSAMQCCTTLDLNAQICWISHLQIGTLRSQAMLYA